MHNLDHFWAAFPIQPPIVQETARKVKELINKQYRSGHIGLMTQKWLTIRLKQPRIPEFYTLTKIHKKTPVNRPIVSGSSGPTEGISDHVYFVHPSTDISIDISVDISTDTRPMYRST